MLAALITPKINTNANTKPKIASINIAFAQFFLFMFWPAKAV